MPQRLKPRTGQKPKPPADPALPPPEHLSAAAAEIWRETADKLAARGTPVNPADGILLETFAMAVVRQRRVDGELEATPLTDLEGKITPLIRVAASSAATVASLARALGLSPTARQQPPKTPQKANPIWDGVKP
jgi:P27 family predicted phage terminase small subunit